MKEIKAYVRLGSLARVIDCLEEERARDLAVTHVRAIGALGNTEEWRSGSWVVVPLV